MASEFDWWVRLFRRLPCHLWLGIILMHIMVRWIVLISRLLIRIVHPLAIILVASWVLTMTSSIALISIWMLIWISLIIILGISLRLIPRLIIIIRLWASGWSLRAVAMMWLVRCLWVITCLHLRMVLLLEHVVSMVASVLVVSSITIWLLSFLISPSVLRPWRKLLLIVPISLMLSCWWITQMMLRWVSRCCLIMLGLVSWHWSLLWWSNMAGLWVDPVTLLSSCW